MDAKTVLKNSLAMADLVSLGYLNDMTDADLMHRPHPGCNHVNWQMGHLIASERQMMVAINPEKTPALPEGFAEKYDRGTGNIEDPAQFLTKDQLMELFKTQRAATLAFLESLTEEQLDAPSGIDYAPTFGDVISLQGSHWLMHCGQWVVVRRMTDKPIVM